MLLLPGRECRVRSIDRPAPDWPVFERPLPSVLSASGSGERPPSNSLHRELIDKPMARETLLDPSAADSEPCP
jgi:hypothetical protein